MIRPIRKSTKASAKKPALLAGGNPQIAKAHGDAPVQAYIAAMPGWKRDLGRRLDALIARHVPNVRKAVKWNSPFYGIEGRGWFLGFHVFTHCVKVTFFRGTSLRPIPPGGTAKDARWIDIHENDLDEAQMATWIRQAASIPGWDGGSTRYGGSKLHDARAASRKPASANQTRGLVVAWRGVRYQVEDVARSIEFYTQRLGFKLDAKHLPAFAQVSIGELQLILSGPGASGSRPMPDGVRQQPGGWNRIVLQVADLAAVIEELKKAGLHLRNAMESGPGGKQVQLDDPDGNPIELFEPTH